MLLDYHEPASHAFLRLALNEPVLGRAYQSASSPHVLTVLWNRGSDTRLEIDGQARTLPAHALLSLTPEQTFRLPHASAVVAWQFNRDFYCIVDHDEEVSCVGLVFYGAHQPTIQLTQEEERSFENLLEMFLDEYRAHDLRQGEMLRLLLKRLLIKLTRLMTAQHLNQPLITEAELGLIRRFNWLVEQHFREKHSVVHYADLLNKSAKTLSNLFSEQGQKSPLRIIHERIATEAKRLLIYTDKPVKEIAFHLGFTDVSAFHRFFKKQAGLSPSAFKNAGLHELINRPA